MPPIPQRPITKDPSQDPPTPRQNNPVGQSHRGFEYISIYTIYKMGKNKGGGLVGGGVGGGGVSGMNGGIMGSGVFGHFGSTVHCNSNDGSMYCEFVKIFNVLIMCLMIFVIIYLVYTFSKIWFSNSSRGGSSKR